jgi:hypothetical protein
MHHYEPELYSPDHFNMDIDCQHSRKFFVNLPRCGLRTKTIVAVTLCIERIRPGQKLCNSIMYCVVFTFMTPRISGNCRVKWIQMKASPTFVDDSIYAFFARGALKIFI